MANELVLIFTKSNIQELMDKDPEKIVVRTTIEEGRLDSGEMVGVVRVFADAMRSGEVLQTVTGCPKPPCSTD